MNILFAFHTVQKTTNEVALLDSGATENFLDEEVWKRLLIGQFWLPKPLTVHNVDGTKNCTRKIEFYCWLKIHYQERLAWMRFYLTSLGGDDFIFGYPFLYLFNPDIDWQEGKLLGGLIQLETAQFSQAEQWVNEYQEEAHQRAGKLGHEEEIWVRHTSVAQ